MRRNALLLMVGLVAAMLVTGAPGAYAQDVSLMKVPFSFNVGNKVMPAGNYEISVASEAVLTLTPTKGAAMAIPVITRLAEQGNAADARFVFDQVGGQYHLSEVWLPTRDGYLVHDTRATHTHKIIKGAKKGT